MKTTIDEFYSRYYFNCECSDIDHTLAIDIIDDVDFPMFAIECPCSPYLPWYARILVALKYIFGKTSKHNHFVSSSLKPQDVKVLECLCHDYCEKYLEKK